MCIVITIANHDTVSAIKVLPRTPSDQDSQPNPESLLQILKPRDKVNALINSQIMVMDDDGLKGW